MRTSYAKLSTLIFLLPALCHCLGNDKPDLLRYPDQLALDASHKRLFIVDYQLNGLNLLDISGDPELFERENADDETVGLLTEDDPRFLPLAPKASAALGLEDGRSRLFVIGSESGPSQHITALDYDEAGGLRPADLPNLSVPGTTLDVLGELALDGSRLWVSNTSSGKIYAFDATTGENFTPEGLPLGSGPSAIAVDAEAGRLAVALSLAPQVALVDLKTETTQNFDVGLLPRDVAWLRSATDTLLVVTAREENRLRIFRLDLASLANSALLFEFSPADPGSFDPELLTGTLEKIVTGQLSDGRFGVFVTQSSGDLLVLRFNDLAQEPRANRIEIGSIGTGDILATHDDQGRLRRVYFASPGLGVLTIVDPLEDDFADQFP